MLVATHKFVLNEQLWIVKEERFQVAPGRWRLNATAAENLATGEIIEFPNRILGGASDNDAARRAGVEIEALVRDRYSPTAS